MAEVQTMSVRQVNDLAMLQLECDGYANTKAAGIVTITLDAVVLALPGCRTTVSG